jgi:hypothetical protein
MNYATIRYLAGISGCDDGAQVSGVSHKVFDLKQEDLSQASSFLSSAASVVQRGLRVLGVRQLGTLIVVALQFFGNFAARLLVRVPLIGALVGAFVSFRKIIRPW